MRKQDEFISNKSSLIRGLIGLIHVLLLIFWDSYFYQTYGGGSNILIRIFITIFSLYVIGHTAMLPLTIRMMRRGQEMYDYINSRELYKDKNNKDS